MIRSARQRLLVVLTGIIALVATNASWSIPTAHAQGGSFLVKATLDGRTAKDMSNHAYPNKYAAGTYVSVVCQDTGPVTYDGSNIWDYTSDHLWVVDYYVKTGYSGFDPNVSRCDDSNSPAGPGPDAKSFPATATMDGRTAKDMSNHAYPNRYPVGQNVNVVCQDSGPVTYNGSTVWDYTTERLWVVDYYVKTGYSGFDPNLPRCGDGGTPPNYGAQHFVVTATLDGRTVRDLDNHAYPNRYAAGTTVGVTCQDSGPEAYGSTVWDFTTESLWVVDRYVKTGYSGFDPGLPRCGSTPSQPPSSSGARAAIVAAAQSQVGVYPEHNRDNCEPYSTNFATPYRCGVPWCAIFASWVWRKAGVWSTNYAGTNQFYYWGADRGLLRSFSNIAPGDVILYGSGPASTATSVHMGVVEKVYSDGTISSIEGNWSDGVVRKDHLNPRATGWEPIYAVVSPVNDGSGSGIFPSPSPSGNQFLATQTLDGRTAKDMSNHAYPNKYPIGTLVTVKCQDSGPVTYGGSTVWDYTAQGLWVVDYYVKTGYSGFDPDLPRCASPPPPPTPPTTPNPPKYLNPAYTEAYNTYFGLQGNEYQLRSVFGSTGGGTSTDLIIARAVILKRDFQSDIIGDRDGFSDRAVDSGRAVIAWEPVSGNTSIALAASCLGFACEGPLPLQKVDLPIPFGHECDQIANPGCASDFDHNSVGIASAGTAKVSVGFQLANGYSTIPGFPFVSPGAIDGAVSMAQNGNSYSVSLSADQFPSWEFIRIPKYNTTGNYETHLFGTRTQYVFQSLCTSCYGQVTTSYTG